MYKINISMQFKDVPTTQFNYRSTLESEECNTFKFLQNFSLIPTQMLQRNLLHSLMTNHKGIKFD